MKIGYCRCSTEEQNTARQEVLMVQLGVERVYIDRISGKSTQRPQLQEMMSFCRAGDTIIVSEIARFARNTKDLLALIEDLSKKGVDFVSQKEAIDTTTPQGKFMLTVFAAVAELERESILQRQAEGIAIAKAEGKFKGRRKREIDNFDSVVELWNAKLITAREAAKRLGISTNTLYRRIKDHSC